MTGEQEKHGYMRGEACRRSAVHGGSGEKRECQGGKKIDDWVIYSHHSGPGALMNSQHFGSSALSALSRSPSSTPLPTYSPPYLPHRAPRPTPPYMAPISARSLLEKQTFCGRAHLAQHVLPMSSPTEPNIALVRRALGCGQSDDVSLLPFPAFLPPHTALSSWPLTASGTPTFCTLGGHELEVIYVLQLRYSGTALDPFHMPFSYRGVYASLIMTIEISLPPVSN